MNYSRRSIVPGSTVATRGNNAGERCAPRGKRWIWQTWQKLALFKCGVFYSCVLTHYFMVGFSLYTENKVIIFSPFIDVCKFIAVGVFYGSLKRVQF